MKSMKEDGRCERRARSGSAAFMSFIAFTIFIFHAL